MFRIKVCGVTRPEDAAHAVRSGADAIGLNFYAPSPRSLKPERAAEVVDACGDALTVGVFVNASAEEINRTVADLGLGAIQLHGDEPAEFVHELPPETPVIRAVRMRPETGLAPVAQDLERLRDEGRPYAAVLVDAAGSAGQYGGTGHLADWEAVAGQLALVAPTPLILAGGLTPENVAAALQQTGADGADTASGVESAPGVKDPDLVTAFVKAAAQSLDGR